MVIVTLEMFLLISIIKIPCCCCFEILRLRNCTDGGKWIDLFYKIVIHIALLPSANEVWSNVMFSHVFICPQGGGVGFPACITGHMTRGFARPLDADPSGGRPFSGYGQQAGGTHPTGMLVILKGISHADPEQKICCWKVDKFHVQNL